jgi:nicotinamidase-related amidase
MPRASRLALIAFVLLPIVAAGQGKTATLDLVARSRVPAAGEKDRYQTVEKTVSWPADKTAIIVCDMWDAHHCYNAVQREEEMVPRMNTLLEKGRGMGALIIHAPSSCMEPYKDHPARQRAQAAPKAKDLPADIHEWCRKIPAEEKGKYPIDQTDGGEDDDLQVHAAWHAKLAAMGRNPKAPWKSQHAGLKIYDQDAISDSGVEIWNLLTQRGIDHVVLVGVHTNMCVLGRPFGLRQLAKNGKDVVLMRDMTDTMYNPARWPYVNHYKGTELIVEHVEKFVCPTVTSDQVLGGRPFRFKGDPNP